MIAVKTFAPLMVGTLSDRRGVFFVSEVADFAAPVFLSLKSIISHFSIEGGVVCVFKFAINVLDFERRGLVTINAARGQSSLRSYTKAVPNIAADRFIVRVYFHWFRSSQMRSARKCHKIADTEQRNFAFCIDQFLQYTRRAPLIFQSRPRCACSC